MGKYERFMDFKKKYQAEQDIKQVCPDCGGDCDTLLYALRRELAKEQPAHTCVDQPNPPCPACTRAENLLSAANLAQELPELVNHFSPEGKCIPGWNAVTKHPPGQHGGGLLYTADCPVCQSYTVEETIAAVNKIGEKS